MAVNAIPEKVVNYNVYDENERLVGVSAEVELPAFESMSETIGGAGIAGEYESPTVGHFGSMEVSIPFRTLTEKTFSLLKNKGKSIYLRAAQSSYDVAAGESKTRGLKITLRGVPKGAELGTLGVGQPTETANTMEILYIKIEEDGKELLEYDKLNFIFRVLGEDMFAQIRQQI